MSLTKIFEDILNKEQPKSSSLGQFKIKPSTLGSKCLRKVYYVSAGVSEDFEFDLSGKRRMKLGDYVHSMLHDIYDEAGILIKYINPDGTTNLDWKNPTKIDYEFPLSSEDLFIKRGKIDAVIEINNELWIGEYKSINMNGFSNLTQAKPEHIIQAVVYLYVFNQMLASGAFSHIEQLAKYKAAKGVKFLYLNKDDTALKEFTLTNCDEIFGQIVEKIMVIRQAYETKQLPGKTPDFCKTCNYRTKCQNNYNI
jgi:CRISPR/Cas system-associated exonuclease Cas4 (RecB family)